MITNSVSYTGCDHSIIQKKQNNNNKYLINDGKKNTE